MADEHEGTEDRGTREPERPPAARDPAATVPPGLGSEKQAPRKKLVLHMDLNNTILVSDSVTGQGTVAALDYFLTTVTWGRMSESGKWEWLSDSASMFPPCSGAASYYSQFGRSPCFTSVAGRRFRGLLEEHLELLRWPEGAKVSVTWCRDLRSALRERRCLIVAQIYLVVMVSCLCVLQKDPQLSVRGEDGRLYHWILPSFFQLIRDLAQEGREFAIVFRTFGSDLPRVLRAMSRALKEGLHPLFPDLPELQLSVDMTPGKIRCSRRGIVLSRAEDRLSTSNGERGLYQYLSSVQGLGGFQDHFDWWASNTFSIRGGKPLWIDPFDQHVQHIFIDDNIRQNDEDTIVSPKVFLEPGGSDTRPASTSELYDISLVRTNLLQAISDHSYFTGRVHICLENYERNLQNGFTD
uniref:Si:dkey-32e6.3 n=1 Tax=Cyprinodon variegatus TaxID=28743 RepID=A0A3Q2CUR4_CYPVA